MNPYNKLGPSKFWKLEVATKHFSEIDLASHRFDFKKFNKISAYGSCFAQRFITFLRDTGDSFLDCELSPNNIPPSQQSNFGYGLYYLVRATYIPAATYSKSLNSRRINMNQKLFKRQFWKKRVGFSMVCGQTSGRLASLTQR